MNPLNTIKRYKSVGIGALVMAFLSLIFSLNQTLLPSRLFGMLTTDIADVAAYLILAGGLIGAYCFLKYDYSLHVLNLTHKDVSGDEDSEFEASPSKIKRDRAKKARKLQQRRKGK